MYEQMRNDVLVALTPKQIASVNEFIMVLDNIAKSYDIKKKEEGLTLYDGELPESVKFYLISKKMAGLADGTLENYQLILTLFFLMVKKIPEQVTSNDIRLWLYAYQKGRNVSNRTLDKYREIINRYFTWSQKEGYIIKNPAISIEPIRYEVKPRNSLTQVQLEYLRIGCKTKRETAILEVLYSTGCRVSELSIIKKSDIDWRDMSVHLFGKGKKHRYSFLNAKAEVALKTYLSSRTDDCEYLFISERKPYRQLHKDGIEKILRDISKRASIDKTVTPHILRHTMATIALQNGMPIEDISKLLGHESIDTTMIYAKSSLESIRSGHKKYVI